MNLERNVRHFDDDEWLEDFMRILDSDPKPPDKTIPISGLIQLHYKPDMVRIIWTANRVSEIEHTIVMLWETFIYDTIVKTICSSLHMSLTFNGDTDWLHSPRPKDEVVRQLRELLDPVCTIIIKNTGD
jgi:hypothetical protein